MDGRVLWRRWWNKWKRIAVEKKSPDMDCGDHPKLPHRFPLAPSNYEWPLFKSLSDYLRILFIMRFNYSICRYKETTATTAAKWEKQNIYTTVAPPSSTKNGCRFIMEENCIVSLNFRQRFTNPLAFKCINNNVSVFGIGQNGRRRCDGAKSARGC